jgi:valyl-tRNA synthetase
MGWDDNGLPTERRVENHYGVRCDPSLTLRPRLHPAREARPEEAGELLAPQLRRAVPGAHRQDEQVFEDTWRRVGLSVDWS